MSDEMMETPIQVGNGEETLAGPSDNFAEDKGVKEYILENVVPLMTTTVNARSAIHSEWQQIRRMTTLEHDKETQKYIGRSNVYVPAYAKNLSSAVNSISSGLFPSHDFLSVSACEEEYASFAEGVKAWMTYQFVYQAKLRPRMKPFLRQLKNFGLSAGKLWYHEASNPVRGSNPMRTALAAMGMGGPGSRNSGLRFRAVSAFAWYVWPTTIDNIREAVLVFENVQVSRQFVESMFRRGLWRKVQVNPTGVISSDTEAAWADALQSVIKDSSMGTDTGNGELAEHVFVQEVYVRMPLPSGAYGPDDEKDTPVPVQIVLLDGEPVLVQRNPFWFQHAPYVVKQDNEMPNEFYGTGLGRMAKGLQPLLNDLVNQTNDNGIFGLNPMIRADPNLMVKAGKIAPGATWWGPKDSFEFFRPPVEQLQYGMMLQQQAMSWLTDLLGTPPILQGTSSRGAAKTATGAQILQNNVRGDIQDGILDIEDDVLLPLCDLAYMLGQQYENADRMVKIAKEPIKVPKEVWAGEYFFEWLASSQVANAQMRVQTAMQLLEFSGRLLPLIQQYGRGLNPIGLLRRMFEDLGYKDFNDTFPSIGMAPMDAVGPGAGQGGASPLTSSNAGASAVDQAVLGQEGNDTASGEGEAFGEVRDQADMLAGMLGG